MKKIKWKLEYSVTLFVIFSVICLLLPVSVGSTVQANLISKWNEKYNRVEFLLKVINEKITEETRASFVKPETSSEREELMLQLIKPYFKIDTSMKISKHYRIKYMDKVKVSDGQFYSFKNIFYTEDGNIIGIKYVENHEENEPIFLLMFDLNGILPPNTWGKDVFGLNVFNDATVEAFGYNLSMEALIEDCSSKGTGVNCSYYYKIGGSFDEK